MVGVAVAQFLGYLADGFVGAGEKDLAAHHRHLQDVLLSRLSCCLFDKVAEIIGRQAEFVGAILYCGEAVLARLTAGEIVHDDVLETGEQRALGRGMLHIVTVVNALCQHEQRNNQ